MDLRGSKKPSIGSGNSDHALWEDVRKRCNDQEDKILELLLLAFYSLQNESNVSFE